MTAGQRLKQWRDDSETSRRSLSIQLNITERQIARWEDGEARPGWDKAKAIEEITGIEVQAWA